MCAEFGRDGGWDARRFEMNPTSVREGSTGVASVASVAPRRPRSSVG
jgi:hypothetical protein